jgi:hypothetical protein
MTEAAKPETAAGVGSGKGQYCDRCGKPDAVTFGDRTLCRDCYFACNSCCLEFGGDDLWQTTEQSDEKA